MKSKPILTLSLAMASLVLLCPRSVQAQEPTNDQQTDTTSTEMAPPSAENPAVDEQTADRMVPAEAALKGTLDAKKTQPGDDVEAVLTSKVHLKNGTELPRGTTLVGKIETDDTHQGASKLALRFTDAKLKDGSQVPIEAAIVGVAPPASGPDGEVTPGTSLWNGQTVQFDEENVMSGVDLHSRIAGENSGTFVSTKKDVKLINGSQLALVIGSKGNA